MLSLQDEAVKFTLQCLKASIHENWALHEAWREASAFFHALAGGRDGGRDFYNACAPRCQLSGSALSSMPSGKSGSRCVAPSATLGAGTDQAGGVGVAVALYVERLILRPC